jgi:hypothetical protein
MLVDIVGFTIFMTAALCHRHRSEIHKRFMLLAMVSLLPPAVVRWPKPPLAFVASIPIRLVVLETDAWRRIASGPVR